MGDKAFILAGLLMGFIFSIMHGGTSPKKLFIGALIGGVIGMALYILVIVCGYTFTPVKVK